MVTSPDYRHVPTGTLSVLAQRLGKVWASPSTWYRLVRQKGWRRPSRGRRFTTADKLEILRRADGCTRHGELGALLRKEGLYSSHLITWRQQREAGLTPKKRGRKAVPVDPAMKKLEQENRRLTTRLKKAEALLDFQKKLSSLLQIPLIPFESDEGD
jgi:transposase-like protein